jgi:hypothetical protein
LALWVGSGALECPQGFIGGVDRELFKSCRIVVMVVDDDVVTVNASAENGRVVLVEILLMRDSHWRGKQLD